MRWIRRAPTVLRRRAQILAGTEGRRVAAGLRRHPPKIVPRGAPAQDFVVQGPQTHGVPGLINLFGIESPGLTPALALADYVVEVAASERLDFGLTCLTCRARRTTPLSTQARPSSLNTVRFAPRWHPAQSPVEHAGTIMCRSGR